MKNLKAKILGIVLIMAGTSAMAGPAVVKVCTDVTETTCKYAALPAKAGHVIKIIRGNWVSSVAASGSWLALTEKHASLCYMPSKTTTIECYPVLANVPKDTDVDFRDMGSGLKLVVYNRRPGATEAWIDFYRTAEIFSRVVNETAAEVQKHANNAYHAEVASQVNARAQANDTNANGAARGPKKDGPVHPLNNGIEDNPCKDGEECRYLPSEDSGGYESGSAETWDVTSDYWEYDTSSSWPTTDAPPAEDDNWFSDEFDGPVVQVPGPESQPEWQNTSYPGLDHVWPAAPEILPDLPPSTDTEVEPVSSNPPSCVATLFGFVCTAPRNPPPVIDPADQIPPVWNPGIPKWNLCNTFNIFCADNDRGPNASHDGKTYEELAAVCLENNLTDHRVCEAGKSMGADYRVVRACHERADARYAQCLTTAREVSQR